MDLIVDTNAISASGTTLESLVNDFEDLTGMLSGLIVNARDAVGANDYADVLRTYHEVMFRAHADMADALRSLAAVSAASGHGYMETDSLLAQEADGK